VLGEDRVAEFEKRWLDSGPLRTTGKALDHRDQIFLARLCAGGDFLLTLAIASRCWSSESVKNRAVADFCSISQRDVKSGSFPAASSAEASFLTAAK
jgi:hypothetical protein